MRVKEVYDLAEVERIKRHDQYAQDIGIEKLPKEEKDDLSRKRRRLDLATHNDREKSIDAVLEDVWQITSSTPEAEECDEYEGVPIDQWLDMYFDLRIEIAMWYDDKLGFNDEDE
jgi:hypothetical protein